MRMHMRRFTRLTNAFSKKIDNHIHALALYFVSLQFLPHPQDASGHPGDGRWFTDRLWSMDDVVALIDSKVEPPKTRAIQATSEGSLGQSKSA